MAINDGGSAFPGQRYVKKHEYGNPYCEDVVPIAYPGMTLRDYLAAQALAVLINRPFADDVMPRDMCAEKAYCYADAMLKAREERKS